MKILGESVKRVSRVFNMIGGVFLIAMILLTCANILCRALWVPIPGTFELLGFFGALTASLALGHTHILRGHIAVDILTRTYPSNTRRIVRVVNRLLFFLLFAIACGELWAKALTLMRTGEVTETLNVGYHPFVFGVSAGCGLLAAVFFAELIAVLIPRKEIPS
jgi:TRAP-type C4-dicarboxylate transport system permease small subunit